MYYNNIYYMISHIFLMLFLYLFIESRFTKQKTAGICFLSFATLCITDCLKLNIFSGIDLCYTAVTLFQIFAVQFTGLFISRKKNSKALFVGLSASNYVIVGSVAASVFLIWTGDMPLSILGSTAVHAGILLFLYHRTGSIWLKFQRKESPKSWWELCLIPVLFYCSFSYFAFFPNTLYDNPQNIIGVLVLIVTMLVSYSVAFQYVESESDRADSYWKNVMFESYIKGLENQYYLVEQSEKNLQILRHDMRHYSNMIDSFLEQQEYDEIKKVTAHINTVADENKRKRYCGNLIANTIIARMIEKANSLVVEVHLDAVIEKEIPVNGYEFALVLANLFENAIDCVKEFEKNKKFVDVKIRCEEEYLLIHMKNKYEKEILFDPYTGLPKSRKGGSHGWGMQSVQAFSDKIGGNLGCYCEGGMFHIMLFAKF
ncbi:MAG: GHKL domain-containing protein [Lachnospiraceae bacterium]|nr:GHKL domain-containing protein [Lachnospiraceae bacterium]